MKSGKRDRYSQLYGQWLRDKANGHTKLNFNQYQQEHEKKQKEKILNQKERSNYAL